jgi:hypothetical protein
MKMCLAVVFLLCFLTDQSRGANPGQPPAAPEGWKYVLSKDSTYQFLLPTNTRSIGWTSRKFTVRGIRAEVLMNYCTLRDDTTYFDVEGATLTGRGLSSLKLDDLYEIMLEGQRQQGYTIGEPKETTLGKIKAQEYRMRKGNMRCRAVLMVFKDRVIQMRVSAADEASLDSNQASTYFQSFSILKESPDAESKEDSKKAQERAKETMAKFGFKWTLKPEEMTAPDKPVAGLILGKEFKPDSIVREASGNLRFRQGEKANPEVDVLIVMFTSPKDKFENRTIEIRPDRKSGNAPTVLLTTYDPAKRIPMNSSSFDKYAIKLHFGAKGADGMIPCTIYLCMSDAHNSFMAGKFTLPAK